jgi:signal transduction histidine kinase
MSTRITLSILLTTWIILIVGEAAAYFLARQSLIALLDDALITRATQVLARSGDALVPPEEQGTAVPQGDRFQIRDQWGNLVLHSAQPRPNVSSDSDSDLDGSTPNVRPVLIYHGFRTRDDGTDARVITLRTLGPEKDGKREPITITYSRPSDRFNLLLTQLAFMLGMIGLACGLTTAWLALKLSRAALRPVRETADAIAQIDEKNLSMRIDVSRLPVELVPMTRRLNELLERLENVFHQRKQFLADAAHELRTPTAALLTTLEVSLRRPRDSAAMTETLKSGLADARRLRKLVEQLMEHARAEHIRVEDAAREFDVAALLRECMEVVNPLAEEKEIVLHQDLPDVMLLVTQRDRLRSIVLNLLSNSIEYNHPGGSVTLSASCDEQTLRIVVSDTGQGIPAEQLPQIFEPFFRGGGGRGDDPSHLGLGLFLVRSHVQALGGQSQIQSRLGEGTTITITIPAVQRSDEPGRDSPIPLLPGAESISEPARA